MLLRVPFFPLVHWEVLFFSILLILTLCFPLFKIKGIFLLLYGYEKPAISCKSFCFITAFSLSPDETF